MKYEVKNRYTGKVQFTAEIECDEGASPSVKLGLAVKWGYKNGADLSGANLRYADLSYTNFRGANLRYADLHCADLSGANLRYANLSGVDLSGANLSGVDLHCADLRYANFRDADLSYTNFRGANFLDANFRDANFIGVENLKLPHFQICPEEGSFIAWKKLSENHIAKLEIPAKAKRTSTLVGRKCRASYVKTVCIYDIERNEYKGEVSSTHDDNITYKKDRLTKANKYDDSPLVECTNGIHFFMTRKEAEEY